MNFFLVAVVAAAFIQGSYSAPTTPAKAGSKGTSSPESMMIMERTMSVGSLDQFMVVFGVSPCMAACALEMDDQFSSRSNTTEDAEANFKQSCDEYLAASSCFQQCPEADDHIFDIMSAGADYMCVEKREQFEHAMPCIAEQRAEMKEECRQRCAPEEEQEDALNKGAIHTSVDEEEQFNNSSALFAQVSVLCEVMHCTIECTRDWLNERCDSKLLAGDLVTEVMIRPLEKNVEFLKSMGSDVEETIRKALPATCAFIIDEDKLEAFRHHRASDEKDSEKDNDVNVENRPTPFAASRATTRSTPFAASRASTPFSPSTPSTTRVSRNRTPITPATTPVNEELQRLQNRERRSYPTSSRALATSALAATSAFKILV